MRNRNSKAATGKAAPAPAGAQSVSVETARQALAILDQATQPSKAAMLTRGDYTLVSQALEVLGKFIESAAGAAPAFPGPGPAMAPPPPNA